MRGGRDEGITVRRRQVVGKAVDYRYIPMESYAHASCPMLPLTASHLDLCAPISGGRVVALLCLHLSVRLDVDVLVGREGGDDVVGDLGAVVC